MTNSNNPKPRKSNALSRLGAKSQKPTRIISWAGADAALLYELIVAVNEADGAVLFGSTPDRGSWVAQFFHDALPNRKAQEYCNEEEQLNDWLAGLVELWQLAASEINGPEAK